MVSISLARPSHSTLSSYLIKGTARYEISLSELDSEELIKQDEIAVAASECSISGLLDSSASGGGHCIMRHARAERMMGVPRGGASSTLYICVFDGQYIGVSTIVKENARS